MKETYVFDYVNENEYRKLERSIKKYNMLAYKKLHKKKEIFLENLFRLTKTIKLLIMN